MLSAGVTVGLMVAVMVVTVMMPQPPPPPPPPLSDDLRCMNMTAGAVSAGTYR